MPALYAGKRVGKPLMRSHTYNAMFNGKLVWPLDKDTVVSIRITDDKGRTLPKSLAVNGTLKLGAKATYADGHVGDLLTWMPDGEKNGYMHDKVHPNAKAMNVAAHKIRE